MLKNETNVNEPRVEARLQRISAGFRHSAVFSHARVRLPEIRSLPGSASVSQTGGELCHLSLPQFPSVSNGTVKIKS